MNNTVKVRSQPSETHVGARILKKVVPGFFSYLLICTIVLVPERGNAVGGGCGAAAAKLQLPAYSKDADVSYFFESPGLSISLKLGPCSEDGEPGQAKEFELRYDPSKFWPGSLMRRSFGAKKLSYNLADVREWSTSYFMGFMGAEGEVVEIYLRHPLDLERNVPEGPLMMIDRKNGQIILYPAGSNADTPFRADFIRGLWTETQQKLSKRLTGNWNVFRDR